MKKYMYALMGNEIHRTMKVDTYFYLTNHSAECYKFKMLAIRLNLVLTQKLLSDTVRSQLYSK